MFEVLGSEGFLLTRGSEILTNNFPEGIFVTYDSREDCLDKIDYYLKHEDERLAIALAGKKFVHQNFDYEDIALSFGNDLKQRLASSAR